MNLAGRDYQEKRNYIRMYVDAPLTITLNNHETLHGMCHNLSGSGLLISASMALPTEAEMEVELSSYHGHHPTLKVIAKVARVVPSESTFKAGLEIVRIL